MAVDICLVFLSFFVVLMWFPLATPVPFRKYDAFALLFASVWILANYLTHRYVRVKYMKVGSSTVRLLSAAALSFGVMEFYMQVVARSMNYSVMVLSCIWLTMLVFSFFFLLLSHAYFYALDEGEEVRQAPEEGIHEVLVPPHRMQSEEQRRYSQQQFRGNTALVGNKRGSFLIQYHNAAYCRTL